MRTLTVSMILAAGLLHPIPLLAENDTIEFVLEPSKQEVVHLLIENHEVMLDPKLNPGCTLANGRTLGEYLSFLVATLAAADDDDSRRVRAGCFRPTAATSLFIAAEDNALECLFEVSIIDREARSPWQYGVRFRLAAKSKSLDRRYIACPGTS